MLTPTPSFPRTLGAAALACLLSVALSAQASLPPAPVSLDSLTAFRAPPANWQLASGLGGDPRTEKQLAPLPGTGVLVNTPAPGAKGNLLTAWEHGDCELELDFLLTPGSNSGIYLMGRYEVQLRDSGDVTQPTPGDCGGIYSRWDSARGPGQEAYEGHAPRANAGRAPGLWQHLRIEFRAPRFDAAGKKIADARFVKVVLNGFTIHENADIGGPTRSAAFSDEAPLGPLMIQGDHGAVALRSLAIKRFDLTAAPVRVENLTHQLRTGSADQTSANAPADAPPALPATSLAVKDLVKSGPFSVTFSGRLIVPRDGAYLFTAETRQPLRLLIDGQPAIASGSGSSSAESMPRQLAAGPHEFLLNYQHNGRTRPELRLMVEGPELAPHALAPAPAETPAPAPRAPAKPKTLLIEPSADRVRIQRGFVPFDPKKRLYAINVGSPAGLHFTYDTETAAILRMWRGDFLDTFEMWDGRGENQYAKPAGPALTLANLPALALLERAAHDWPDEPDAMWTFHGYRLEPDGLPVFSFALSTLKATDRLAPLAGGRGLTRTLTITGEIPSWEPWVLLAEAAQITALPDGLRYVIGDRDYYLDLPADSTLQPIVRTRHGRQQLVVPVGKSTLGQPIVYTLVW